MEGVELREALVAIDAWIEEKCKYMKRVKSLIGPVLIFGKYTSYHVILIKRPETGLYQAIAERGLVIEWLPDTPEINKAITENIEVREEPIPKIIKLPIDEIEDFLYSNINKKNGLDKCINKVTKLLETVEKTSYHMALKNDFTNKLDHAAKRMIRFYKRESKKYDVKALYFEASRLESNPVSCHMFSYVTNGGLSDLEWLTNYQGDIGLDFLKGFGRLRNVFENEDPTVSASYKDLHKASELLFMLKFQRFIRRAYKLTEIKNLPAYAAMHESDLIAIVS